jgi:hypothetical protein
MGALKERRSPRNRIMATGMEFKNSGRHSVIAGFFVNSI